MNKKRCRGTEMQIICLLCVPDVKDRNNLNHIPVYFNHYNPINSAV